MSKTLAPVHPGEVLYFGTSAEVWMGLQADYDLQTERDLNGAEIERAVLLPA
jgi:plasmid maintenance system antidote protein VapI